MAGKIAIPALFLIAGIMHFAIPVPFIRIVPPMLPWPEALVALSGATEILGGAGLLFSRTRRPAAYGLVLLLLIAVFPANIYLYGCGPHPIPRRCRSLASTTAFTAVVAVASSPHSVLAYSLGLALYQVG